MLEWLSASKFNSQRGLGPTVTCFETVWQMSWTSSKRLERFVIVAQFVVRVPEDVGDLRQAFLVGRLIRVSVDQAFLDGPGFLEEEPGSRRTVAAAPGRSRSPNNSRPGSTGNAPRADSPPRAAPGSHGLGRAISWPRRVSRLLTVFRSVTDRQVRFGQVASKLMVGGMSRGEWFPDGLGLRDRPRSPVWAIRFPG